MIQIGDRVQHKTSRFIGIVNKIDLSLSILNVVVQLPSGDINQIWWKHEVDLFMSSSSQQPSPYSGGVLGGSSQATQLPLQGIFDDKPAVCGCGPRFLDDPHKKDCKVKNETKQLLSK